MEPNHPEISMSRQCELLGLSRSTYYYQARETDNFNLMLMNLIDEQFTRTPFYGVPRMTAWLRRQGYQVNPKRIRRLLRFMGLEAIHPKRNLSKPSKEHKIYPYLLKGVSIEKPTGSGVRISHISDWPMVSFIW